MGDEVDPAHEGLAAINTLLRPEVLPALYSQYPPHVIDGLLELLRKRFDSVAGNPEASAAAPCPIESHLKAESAPGGVSRDAKERSTQLASQKQSNSPTPPSPAVEASPKSPTQRLVEIHGRQEVTFMMHWVILKHVSTQKKASSIKTIFDALKKAELVDTTQRGSVVTSLNRLKKEKRVLAWIGRGKDITITEGGGNYLEELSSKWLQEPELAYLREHAADLYER